MTATLALMVNPRVGFTWLLAGLWLVVAVIGLLAQLPNLRRSVRLYRFWREQGAEAGAAVLIVSQSNLRHNRGRTAAVIINALIGVAVGISPLLYDIPPSPSVPAAAAIGYLLSVGLFANEVILVNIAVREWFANRRLDRLVITAEPSVATD